VLSQIVDHVHAIERHPRLASAARQRFRELGYHNIDLHVGDGTKGWPEAAVFDAILVSAAGPEVPPALKEQLAIGGRLVMPVGLERTGQALLKLTRCSETEFASDTLAAVRFVPLMGEHGVGTGSRLRDRR
jgi:protein-L-isoaspartate(D-aspartate) O-methyltransferase